ncbi:hypothetical protein [Dictyobacter kobayashii]|uniref:PLL-like beta propeller domain-containing protein n=1 Tax=Dictyobacter kobayashii TaxID=2014872 RepID=A0A402AEL6_9CHLR|nr:hypothetical protein [Dictyobacter kobayashii]GCE17558.1 hypothetical protein KDK_13580 [Dictyobacter kobayashii]
MTKAHGIVPIFTPEQLAGIAAFAPHGHVTYQGGHLLTAVEVFPIFWGSAWPTYTDMTLNINQFFNYILTSPLMDLLSEYSVPGQIIGRGRLKGSVIIRTPEPGHPTGSGREINDSEIQQALRTWIANGTIPQPNGNTLYFVYLDSGVTSVFEGIRSCQLPNGFCGYHSNTDNNIFYGVIPSIQCKGCTKDTLLTLQAYTKISSHELCEAITDPIVSQGWCDLTVAKEEIGDFCNTDFQHMAGCTIQSVWSNRANACLIRRPPPVGSLFYAFQTTPNNGFGDWSMLGDAVGLGQIAAISTYNSSIEIFALDTNVGQALTIFQNAPNGDFEGWVSIAYMDRLGQIAVGKNADGCLEVFAIDNTFGSVSHTVQPTPSSFFGDWRTLVDAIGGPGQGLGQIAVISPYSGGLQIFAVDTFGQAWTSWKTGPTSDYQYWLGLGAPSPGLCEIAVARNSDDRLEVFAIDADAGNLWHTAQFNRDSGFPPWTPLVSQEDVGGLRQIAVINTYSGGLQIFAVDTVGQAWTIWKTSSTSDYQYWLGLGAPPAGLDQIAVGKNADGRLEVFAVDRGKDGFVWHTAQPTTSSGFPAWSSVGDLGDWVR